MKNKIKVALLFICAIIWMIVIFKLSSMNTHSSNGKSTNIISMFIEDTLEVTNQYGITNSNPSEAKLERVSILINAPMRKVMHASVYCVLAIFLIIFFRTVLKNKSYLNLITTTISVCIIFALGDEIHQTFVDGRTGRLLDVAIDTLGACGGIVWYSTYYITYFFGYTKGIKSKEKQLEE